MTVIRRGPPADPARPAAKLVGLARAGAVQDAAG